eukprot:CAMPEP_0174914118 /NCGR_PEP_ID=MMETSP0167-20121228/80674_1 /TAXON_ID=38298 /ORGANISM="Rhodella maculata, Strain CCMP736" /LENGTH=97 /DNA_ID=CAMNT_0016158869 /DNA_START=896 /DNA_END=1189 /DNA_ORIENTATION=+
MASVEEDNNAIRSVWRLDEGFAIEVYEGRNRNGFHFGVGEEAGTLYQWVCDQATDASMVGVGEVAGSKTTCLDGAARPLHFLWLDTIAIALTPRASS